MFSMPGHMEIFIVVLVVLLLFGAKRIPELARGLGKGIREFKDGMKQVGNEMKEIDKGENEQKETEKE